MRSLLLILTLILAGTIAGAPLLHAQDDLDIDQIAETVTAREPESLLAALHTPMTDEDLPAIFSDAAFVDPEEISGTTVTFGENEISGVAGTVMYSLAYDPTAAQDASPVASPRAGGGSSPYSAAAVHYLVFDHELSSETLDRVSATLKTALGSQAANADVEEIMVEGTQAYAISVTTVTNDIPLQIEWVALPVGSVVVVSMTMRGGESIDVERVRADAGELGVASIRHLDTVARQDKTPAG